MSINKSYVVYLTIITIVLLEVTLRLLGYAPGNLTKHDGFHQVDSLIVYENFVNDSFGVYRFSRWISDSIPESLNRNGSNPSKVIDDLAEVNWVDDIGYIWETAIHLAEFNEDKEFDIEQGEEWNAPFVQLFDECKKKQLKTPFDSLVLNYSMRPYNSDGFRSVSFKPIKTNRKKILILGDSFAYGMTARPYFNSFPDLLLAKGHVIYNTGIPGVDPAQYSAIIKEYLTKLNPDIVILNFYVGNDLMSFPREPNLMEPHEHMTNAGFFSSSPEGTYLSPKDAYNYYLSLQKIPTENTSSFNQVYQFSSALSILWNICYKFGLCGHPTLDKYNKAQNSKSNAERASITSVYTGRINTACDSADIPIINCVIPNRHDKINMVGDFYRTDAIILDQVFGKVPSFEPQNIVDTDFFGEEDYHFNNKGHQKYAKFLDSLINTVIEP